MPGMTQEKLGLLVGLSRTSITNIEKGRQHVLLHQVFAIASALKAPPEALLPEVISPSEVDAARMIKRMPAGTDAALATWAEKVTR